MEPRVSVDGPPIEKETYAVVCCLLKFQAWIAVAEVMVNTDHGSILRWYK